MPQDQAEEIAVRQGRFRVRREYRPTMRVPEMMLKCVGFIGAVTHRKGNEVEGDLCATGFFVAVPSEKRLGSYWYFVTAKHVASDLENEEVYFLVNRKSGGTTRMNGVGDAWYLHPTDNTADVAITQMAVTPDADIIAIPTADFVTPKDFQDATIGIGDEVFITGLFKPVSYSESLLPIVRHGNIAMLPREQVQTAMGYANVYLVEARSIGGLSGSPVWARGSMLSTFKNSQSGKLVPASIVGPGKFFGLMHGHWDVRESAMNEYEIANDPRGVNLGISIVVPAMKILETLYSLPLIAKRNEADEETMKRSVPGTDSLKPKTERQEEPPFTRDEFESSLLKVTRKITPASKK